jgi:hypothetical protein
MWSCFVLIIAISPLIFGVSFIALSPHSNVGSYVYFCSGSNGTVVIETRLLSTEKLDYIKDNERIYGYTRWVENLLFKANQIGIASDTYPISKCGINADTSSEGIDNEILIMTIRAWEERREKNQQESSDVVGVLLIDEDEYRPSSPLKKVTKIQGDSNNPFMFLVRPEDKTFLNQYLNHSTPVDIVFQRDQIPDPKWKCDLGESGCIEYKYHDGYVAGNQYRTKSCYWGGNACSDHQNTLSSEDFCSGPETIACPRDNQEFGEWQEWEDPIRHLRWSPDYCARKLDNIKHQCDNQFPGWTKYLGAEAIKISDNVIKRERRRYCSAIDEEIGETECIFEELEVSFCCDDSEKKCPLPENDGQYCQE